ncbi:MAG: shikimate dehydrogenase [Anaerolineae bacterium]|nr:shikimate dehydrogenase [Anaerolineae bacterium]
MGQPLTFYFIGVTTGQSSVRQIFPRWMEALGRPDVVLAGVDLPLHAAPEAYRQVVAQIKHDPNSLGGLVTTHKINLFEAARDLFDYLDPYAQLCGEVSCISKRNHRLEGHAKDPLTAGASLDALLGENYFGRTGGEVLCLGSGGSATAIALHLSHKPNAGDRPRRFIVVGRRQASLDRLRRVIEQVPSDIAFAYVVNQDPARNDELMAALPDGSLVINATGMGKDLPGSPITGRGLFPRQGIAWEINYRGELDFLHQARAQSASRGVVVEDGWLYFLHGWIQVIAQVLHCDINAELFHRLAAIAGEARR